MAATNSVAGAGRAVVGAGADLVGAGSVDRASTVGSESDAESDGTAVAAAAPKQASPRSVPYGERRLQVSVRWEPAA